VSNVLANTVFFGTPRAVVATSGSDLDILDGSFYDCPMAIDGDAVSDVSWTCNGHSELVNSSARFLGWFTVYQGGSLNISHGNLTFLGLSSSDSGISSSLLSVLRIVNGSRLWGGGSLAPYSVRSEGSLVVQSSAFHGGGVVGRAAALEALGDAAAIGNVTFADCELALRLEGSLPVLRNCIFRDNRQSLLMNGTSRPELIGCDFTSSVALWEMRGTFSSSLVIRGCSFEGAGLVPMAMLLESVVGERPILILSNVTVSNYTVWGLEDLHAGSLLMVDCSLSYANVSTGVLATNSVTMRRVQVTQGVVIIGPGGFIVSDCAFTNGTFKVHDNSGGSRISDSTFNGCPSWDLACLDIDSSLFITITDLDLSSSQVGLRVRGGSEVSVKGCTFDGVIGSALEVNGSIIHLEDCSVTDLRGTGIRAYHVGSRVEMRNCTIQAIPGRTGYDVDATDGGDVWLLNTTLNRTSVLSTGGGRVEVLWFVTVEPSLPWGGTLSTPEYLIVTDVTGEEVINTSLADQIMRLYEFTDEDGDRTWKTPHEITIDDTREGVSYQGNHFVNRSSHFVLDLIDVKAPVARAGIDQVVDENLVVTLNGAGSSDNDPSFHRTGLFRWSFDEGGVEVVLIGDEAKYVFSVPGKYRINLTVTDAAGNVGTDAMIVLVNDRTPPVIRFTGNVTVDEDVLFFFDGTATTDNNPTFDTHVGTFLWIIDVGDKILSWDTSSFGYTFTDPGNYT
ncbi:MAG: right-handed parallel beta-helix repeat-containing protein, partial [Thermoplasmata archaeon]|nr:right-handed parallel beta-helix repeat-containing protein [Thermoplasmata archaeon]